MDPSSRQYQEMPNNNPKPRPQPDQALKCPRCDSTNTKFCYYNNYSLSQPRYFCKSCRRYWTKGGTLRNVPVGGGCRKNRRSSSSSSSKRGQDQPLTLPNTSILLLGYDTTDLSLASARLQKQQPNVPVPHLGFDHDPMLLNPNSLGFIQNENNFQGFYNYGFGNESLGEVDNGGAMMMLPYYNNNGEMSSSVALTTTSDVTVTTMKNELCSDGKDQTENRLVLWGFPWQLSEDHGNNYNIGETWGGVNSSWHGLINSPLM